MGRKRLQPLDSSLFGPESYVDILTAVRLISQELAKSGEMPEHVRDKVRKRVKSALSRNEIPGKCCSGFKFGQLFYWAAQAYPGYFIGWSGMRPVSGFFDIQYSLSRSWSAPMKLPATVHACHELILQQQDVIDSLGRENAALRKRLAGYETRVESLRQKLSAAGRRGGRGNKRED